MKICVFGAASAHIDRIYIERVEELGRRLVKRGHSLVFGAGGSGLMGAAARGVKEAGGYVHGVVPSFFRVKNIEALFEDCDKFTYTETMRERKAIMEDEADAFIVTPGGVGTFEEFFEIVTLKQLGQLDKAIAIFDVNGYYKDLQDFMQTAIERKFITESCASLYETFTDPEEVFNFIENYKKGNISIKKTKIGD